MTSANRASECAPQGAGFPRSRRVLRHADFDRVYERGQRHYSAHVTVLYLRKDSGAARVGFTVGRALGGAVQRKRLRRRLREAVRRQLPELKAPVDLVLTPKKSVLTVDFGELLDEVGRAFQSVMRRISQ